MIDSFNLLVGILLVFLAFQMQQNWIVFVIIAVLILTMKSLAGSLILIAVGAFLYLFAAGSGLKEFFLPILAVLIAVALIVHLKKPKEQAAFPGFGDPYGGGGFGAEGGFGGEGGLGGY